MGKKSLPSETLPSVSFFYCPIYRTSIGMAQCQEQSQIVSVNRMYCHNCDSPWRLCLPCREQGIPIDQALVEPGSTYCDFHKQHGPGANKRHKYEPVSSRSIKEISREIGARLAIRHPPPEAPQPKPVAAPVTRPLHATERSLMIGVIQACFIVFQQLRTSCLELLVPSSDLYMEISMMPSELPDITALAMDELRALRHKIDDRIKFLKVEERRLRERKTKAVALATRWEKQAKALGMTAEEVLEYLKMSVSGKTSKTVGSSSENNVKTGIRYRNPENPEERWGGHGRRPKWVLRCLEKGGKIEDLVDSN